MFPLETTLGHSRRRQVNGHVQLSGGPFILRNDKDELAEEHPILFVKSFFEVLLTQSVSHSPAATCAIWITSRGPESRLDHFLSWWDSFSEV